MSFNKPAIRAFGVAESFERDVPHSILAGVVMRGDLQIDGFSLTSITVGGLDATDGVIRLFRELDRSDINVIMLHGCVISWFNIIQLDKVFSELETPLICVTYEESEGLEEHFKQHFDDWEHRVELYHGLGDREKIKLKTGYEVFIRALGIGMDDVQVVLDRFTTHGHVPEPLRVARLLARTTLKSSVTDL